MTLGVSLLPLVDSSMPQALSTSCIPRLVLDRYIVTAQVGTFDYHEYAKKFSDAGTAMLKKAWSRHRLQAALSPQGDTELILFGEMTS